MNNKINILFLEHDLTDIELIHYELQRSGINYSSRLVENKLNYIDAIENFCPDIILADYRLPSFNGLEAFEIKENLSPETPFIFISGTIGEEAATELIKIGVTDYVLKDKLFTLSNKITRALKETQQRAQKIKTEVEYRESERRLIEAQAMAKIGNWETDLQNHEVIWSAETYKIFDISPGNVKASHPMFLNLVHPSDRELVDTAFLNSLNANKLNRLEHRILLPGGQIKTVEECWRIVFNNSGSPQKAVGTCQDISEKKGHERQRVFDENNLKALINNTKDLLWSVDRNLNLISSNQAFSTIIYKLIGREVTKGTNILTLGFPAEQLDHFTKFFERAFAGESFTATEYIRTPSEKWTEISYTPIYEGNDVIGTACHSRDITLIKKSELQLRQSAKFNRGVLDSLMSHIAVVNSEGCIVAVNKAWTNFSIENGMKDLSATSLGANYFSVCERAAAAGEEVSIKVLQGMKNVLSKEQASFSLEYPCHSPDTKRWFSMNVIKFESTSPMLVIAHHNITERKLAEENLLLQAEKLF